MSMEDRKCEYRNCAMPLKEKRKGAKYCCRACKDNEKKYKMRELRRVERDKDYILEMLRLIEREGIEDVLILERILKGGQ